MLGLDRVSHPSGFPVSCKQSDAERKDFADIPEQGHSESLRGLERCMSTGDHG